MLGAILTKISAPVPLEPVPPINYVTFADPREGEVVSRSIDWDFNREPLVTHAPFDNMIADTENIDWVSSAAVRVDG